MKILAIQNRNAIMFMLLTIIVILLWAFASLTFDINSILNQAKTSLLSNPIIDIFSSLSAAIKIIIVITSGGILLLSCTIIALKNTKHFLVKLWLNLFAVLIIYHALVLDIAAIQLTVYLHSDKYPIEGSIGPVAKQIIPENIPCNDTYLLVKITKDAKIKYLCLLPDHFLFIPSVIEANKIPGIIYSLFSENDIKNFHTLNPQWDLKKLTIINKLKKPDGSIMLDKKSEKVLNRD